MSAFVALLRGVNVGGARLLPMPRLRAMFEDAGAARVTTFIQSGNVVFHSPDPGVATVVSRVDNAIQREFGFCVEIVTRNADQWRALIAGNPYLLGGADPATLNLGCLSKVPLPAMVSRLDPKRSPPDEFTIAGDNVYLRLPNGVGRSKLTNAWFDATLGVVSTMRNWRTVERISALL